jgi:hypothetical protein
MKAEELIIEFHELTCKKNKLKTRNSWLACERIMEHTGSSCIGQLIEQINFNDKRLSEAEFAEILSESACPACVEVWQNKSQIKRYSKQIGSIKNKMHALAKRLCKTDLKAG